MPTESLLIGYYSDYYRKSSVKVAFDQPERFANHLLSLAGEYLQRDSIAVLDFGGGDGGIAHLLARLLLKRKTSHVRVTLVDYRHGTSPQYSSQIAFERFDTLSEVGEKEFDLVLASAVLEHIPDARRELLRLLSFVRSGGLFYARTPASVPIGRIFRRLGLSYDFTYPAHVHDLGQTFWERILPCLYDVDKPYELVLSRPSIVETAFRRHPFRTLAAHLCKALCYVPGSHWSIVGGWEVLIRRTALRRQVTLD